MLYRLMMVICVSVSATALAQTNKITEKPADTQIDYKQVGARMPELRMALYYDTAAGKSNTEKDGYRAEEHAAKRKKKRHEESKMPASTRMLTAKDVDNGANLFVMIFNPTCSHCEDETLMLEKNIALFQKSKILLMASPAMMPYLGNFVQRMGIGEYPAMSVGVDSSGFVNNMFLYNALPQINIYNAERKLMRIWTGEVSIDSLKQYIE